MTFLLFDVDGTLVYSEQRDSRCFAEVYKHIYGKSLPGIDWEAYPHVTDTTILTTAVEQHFRRKPNQAELLLFQEVYIERLMEKRRADPNHSLAVPGARSAIERLLQDERFRIGVATGGWEQTARLKLRHVGIPEMDLPVQGADGKHTREEIICELIDRMNNDHGPVGHIVYVGDALWDVRTMRNLRMPFIGLRWRGDSEVLLQAGARQVISNYLDYKGFLELVEKAEPPE